jgi:hypothetical protein
LVKLSFLSEPSISPPTSVTVTDVKTEFLKPCHRNNWQFDGEVQLVSSWLIRSIFHTDTQCQCRFFSCGKLFVLVTDVTTQPNCVR